MKHEIEFMVFMYRRSTDTVVRYIEKFNIVNEATGAAMNTQEFTEYLLPYAQKVMEENPGFELQIYPATTQEIEELCCSKS